MILPVRAYEQYYIIQAGSGLPGFQGLRYQKPVLGFIGVTAPLLKKMGHCTGKIHVTKSFQSRYGSSIRKHVISLKSRGHGGRVVTLSPPTSEAGVRSPSQPEVGKLVVTCHWSAVYSTEP